MGFGCMMLPEVLNDQSRGNKSTRMLKATRILQSHANFQSNANLQAMHTSKLRKSSSNANLDPALSRKECERQRPQA